MRGCVLLGDWGLTLLKFRPPIATHSENQHHCRGSGHARGKTTTAQGVHRLAQAILGIQAWLPHLKYHDSMQPAKLECLYQDAEAIAHSSHALMAHSPQLK